MADLLWVTVSPLRGQPLVTISLVMTNLLRNHVICVHIWPPPPTVYEKSSKVRYELLLLKPENDSLLLCWPFNTMLQTWNAELDNPDRDWLIQLGLARWRTGDPSLRSNQHQNKKIEYESARIVRFVWIFDQNKLKIILSWLVRHVSFSHSSLMMHDWTWLEETCCNPDYFPAFLSLSCISSFGIHIIKLLVHEIFSLFFWNRSSVV